jgi:hypothetical protein
LDGETQMSTNGQSRNESPNVATSFAGLTHDVIELAELQAQLLALDVKSTSQKARTSFILVAVGVCMLLGTVPIALVTVAELLVQQFGWSRAAGFATATLLGVLLAAGILGAAWSRFRAGVVTMQRSREEFNRNIAWVKSSLRSRAQENPVETN